jgi:hypothetical protein
MNSKNLEAFDGATETRPRDDAALDHLTLAARTFEQGVSISRGVQIPSSRLAVIIP